MKIKFNITIILSVMAFSLFLLVQVLMDQSKPMAQISKIDEQKNLHISQTLKGLELKDSKNKVINFDQISGKPIILNFWASWCVPCLEEIPTLVEFSKSSLANGIQIVAINGDEKSGQSKAEKLIAKYNMDFSVVFDLDSSLFEKFGISGIPVTLILKNGKVVQTYNEAVDFMSGEFQSNIKKLKTNE